MSHAEIIARAGMPVDRRGIVLDELSLIFESYKALYVPAEAKPLAELRKIHVAAGELRDLLESLPPAWRLSLGTIVNHSTEPGVGGAWSADNVIDWRPGLDALIEQAALLQRSQDGKPTARGRPSDGPLTGLLFQIVLLWEREMPDIRGVAVNNERSEGSGPLFELARDLLTREDIAFTSPHALARKLYELTEKTTVANVTNIAEFKQGK
jgi:hypothetical protein